MQPNPKSDFNDPVGIVSEIYAAMTKMQAMGEQPQYLVINPKVLAERFPMLKGNSGQRRIQRRRCGRYNDFWASIPRLGEPPCAILGEYISTDTIKAMFPNVIL